MSGRGPDHATPNGLTRSGSLTCYTIADVATYISGTRWEGDPAIASATTQPDMCCTDELRDARYSAMG
jgi:hypothetical protein